MVFSRAAAQFDEAAAHHEQAALRLDVVAQRAEECVQAILTGAEEVQWHSPAGRAFLAVTVHHVAQCRRRQSRISEISASARLIAADLRRAADQARVLAAALEATLDATGVVTGVVAGVVAGAVVDAADAARVGVPAVGAEHAARALVSGAREASESAEGFLRFVQSHGGLPLARLAAARE
ncbi:hypothetical protein I2485_05705 [Nesterenkonia sp. E16_7]|uniref:hypothetical protein n=1 Tax=unclassified Nesterenkonia TaxID=2629769 RepID=UPI001A93387F|nr:MULTISPECIES: hypothetical protein [unclassified Nesterenkonia]MBO0596903.1 hypothetical protein [Nesterenkonia sp. E16_10]MBO0598143.1 hypothetical protein [Nesterenkonia sp. E16_7]